MKSWKTTLFGLVAGLALLFGELRDLTDENPETVFEWNNMIAGLGAIGVGLSARDNKVTSESAGAK